MIVDSHVHPVLWEEALASDGADLARWGDVYSAHLMGAMGWDEIRVEMDAGFVDLSFVMALDLTTTEGCSVVSNDAVAALVVAHPERLVGFASVDPHRPDAVAELDRCLTPADEGGLGLRGLFLHPSKQRFAPGEPCVEPLLALCEERDCPLYLHAGMSWQPGAYGEAARPALLEPVVAEHPGLRVALTQFGWPWVDETVMLLLKYPNCYTDTAINTIGSPREMMERLFLHDLGPRWLELSLAGQVMFASNTPRFRAFKMIRGLAAVPMPDEVRVRVLGGNALDYLRGGGA